MVERAFGFVRHKIQFYYLRVERHGAGLLLTQYEGVVFGSYFISFAKIGNVNSHSQFLLSDKTVSNEPSCQMISLVWRGPCRV